jgi:hypothetical protein
LSSCNAKIGAKLKALSKVVRELWKRCVQLLCNRRGSEVRELCRSLLAGNQQVPTLDAVRGNLAKRGKLNPSLSGTFILQVKFVLSPLLSRTFKPHGVKRREVLRSATKPKKWRKTVARNSRMALLCLRDLVHPSGPHAHIRDYRDHNLKPCFFFAFAID